MNENRYINLKTLSMNLEAERLKNKQCIICGCDMNKVRFRDELSIKEFEISGMC